MLGPHCRLQKPKEIVLNNISKEMGK